LLASIAGQYYWINAQWYWFGDLDICILE